MKEIIKEIELINKKADALIGLEIKLVYGGMIFMVQEDNEVIYIPIHQIIHLGIEKIKDVEKE